MTNMDNNYDLVYEQDMAYLQSLYEDEQKHNEKEKQKEKQKQVKSEIQPEVKYTEPDVKLTLQQLRAQRISHFEKSKWCS